MSNPQPVIFDTDPGIGAGLDADDPLALMLILASDELELLGVTTTYGNVEVARATESALRVLEAAHRPDIGVHQGLSRAIDGSIHAESLERYERHSQRSGSVDLDRVERGRSSEHAVDFIIRSVHERPGEITLIAVGPLSNVAMALVKDPSIAPKVKQITIMGGAFGFDTEFGRGNVTPVAEYNIWHDPLAAKVVFESGIPLVAVGLDVTNPNKGTVLLEANLQELVADGSEFSEFLYLICRNFIDEPRFDWVRGGCILYDPVAVASVIDPSLVTTRHLPVLVETGGSYGAGQTIPIVRAEGTSDYSIDIAVDVDGDGFVDLFLRRIASLRDATKGALS
jgi:inosine-uridine nucleoside N-ribohydrolase